MLPNLLFNNSNIGKYLHSLDPGRGDDFNGKPPQITKTEQHENIVDARARVCVCIGGVGVCDGGKTTDWFAYRYASRYSYDTRWKILKNMTVAIATGT